MTKLFEDFLRERPYQERRESVSALSVSVFIKNSQLTRYRNAVRQALDHFTRGTYLPPQYLKDVTLFDAVNDRYAVITRGWDKGEYVNELTAEINIVDGKVSI